MPPESGILALDNSLYDHYSDISTPVQRRSPVLFIEIIERILDYIYDPEDTAGNQQTLRSCLLTCRALLPRSRYLLSLRPVIRHAYDCLMPPKRRAPRSYLAFRHTVELDIIDEASYPRPFSSIFVLRFVGQLSGLKRLSISNADWEKYPRVHQSFCNALSRLTSLISLKLSSCNLSDWPQLRLILEAPPSLIHLKLSEVLYEFPPNGPLPSSNYAFCRPLHLDSLIISGHHRRVFPTLWYLLFKMCKHERNSIRKLSVNYKLQSMLCQYMLQCRFLWRVALEALEFNDIYIDTTSCIEEHQELNVDINNCQVYLPFRAFCIADIVQFLYRKVSYETLDMLCACRNPAARFAEEYHLDVYPIPSTDTVSIDLSGEEHRATNHYAVLMPRQYNVTYKLSKRAYRTIIV